MAWLGPRLGSAVLGGLGSAEQPLAHRGAWPGASRLPWALPRRCADSAFPSWLPPQGPPLDREAPPPEGSDPQEIPW